MLRGEMEEQCGKNSYGDLISVGNIEENSWQNFIRTSSNWSVCVSNYGLVTTETVP